MARRAGVEISQHNVITSKGFSHFSVGFVSAILFEFLLSGISDKYIECPVVN